MLVESQCTDMYQCVIGKQAECHINVVLFSQTHPPVHATKKYCEALIGDGLNSEKKRMNNKTKVIF